MFNLNETIKQSLIAWAKSQDILSGHVCHQRRVETL